VIAMAARLMRAWLAAVAASLPAFHGVRVCCVLTKMRTKFVAGANAGPPAAALYGLTAALRPWRGPKPRSVLCSYCGVR
jgi:hypothetical protein